jgi:hypothetical protein
VSGQNAYYNRGAREGLYVLPERTHSTSKTLVARQVSALGVTTRVYISVTLLSIGGKNRGTHL